MKPNLEYEYRPHTTKGTLLTFVASGVLGLIAMCGVVSRPSTADSPGPRRVSLGTLALEEAAGREATSALHSYSGQALLVISGLLAVLLGYLGVRKCLTWKQRIALLPEGVLLPLAEKPIEYRRIRELDVWRVQQADPRALSIVYDKGKRCTVWESGLPSPGAFDEIHAVLKRRTKAAAGTIEE